MIQRSERNPRCAFTVVEVLVALVLVTVGLLAMAGSSGLALRASGAADRERHALARVRSRLAHLGADGCTLASAGSSDADSKGIAERWSVRALSSAAALVADEVSWVDRGRLRTLRVESAILC